MAILITQAKIKNTEITVNNIYGRLSFQAMPNGVNASANLTFYLTKADYELSKSPTFEHKQIMVDVKNTFSLELSEGENQDLVVVTNKVVAELINLGFTATSDIVVS
mgnify:CR=1 FL=1